MSRLTKVPNKLTVEWIEQELRDGNVAAVFKQIGANSPDVNDAEARWLVVVDQFEELFDQEDNPTAAREFVRFLLAAVDEDNIYVALTLRAERVGDCARFDRLTKAVFGGIYLIPPLEVFEIQQAIRGPAHLFDCDVEPSLVNALIDDSLRRDRDYLPLLQYALVRIWIEACARTGGQIPRGLFLEDYDKACRVGSSTELANPIVSQQVCVRMPLERELEIEFDLICKKVASGGEQFVEAVFRRLVLTPPRERSVTHSVRARATVSELEGLISAQAELPIQALGVASDIIDQYRGRDFLVPIMVEVEILALPTEITLCHEALIRQWKRLSDWTMEEAAAAEVFAGLLEDSATWDGSKRVERAASKLNEAIEWRRGIINPFVWGKRYLPRITESDSKSPREPRIDAALRYLLACENAQEWRRRVLIVWWTGAVSAVLLFVMATIGYVAYTHWKADGRRWAYETFDMEGQGDPKERLYMATQSYHRNPHEEFATQAIRDAMWTDGLQWTHLGVSRGPISQVKPMQARELLPDGSIMIGAAAQDFVLLSPQGKIIRLKICSALSNAVSDNSSLAISVSPNSSHFAVVDTKKPNACVYEIGGADTDGIPLVANLEMNPETKFAFKLSPDGRAGVFWSNAGQIRLQYPIDFKSHTSPNTLSLDACRVGEPGDWTVSNVYIGYARAQTPNDVILIDQSPGSGQPSTHAILCRFYGEQNVTASTPSRGYGAVQQWPMSQLPPEASSGSGIEFSATSSDVLILDGDILHVKSTNIEDKRDTIFPLVDGHVNHVISANFVAPDNSRHVRVLVKGSSGTYAWTLSTDGGSVIPMRVLKDSSLHIVGADRNQLLEVRTDKSALLWDLNSGYQVTSISRLPSDIVQFVNGKDEGIGALVVQVAGPDAAEHYFLPLKSLPWLMRIEHSARGSGETRAHESTNSSAAGSPHGFLTATADGSCRVNAEDAPPNRSNSMISLSGNLRFSGPACISQIISDVGVSAIGFSPNGHFAVIGTRSGSFRVVQLSATHAPVFISVTEGERLLRVPIQYVGVGDTGRHVVATYANGTVAVFSCKWDEGVCVEYVRDARHKQLPLGPPTITDDQSGELKFSFAAEITSIFGESSPGEIEVQCLTECGRDEEQLFAAAKDRLATWEAFGRPFPQ
jgi:hypothetical protein